MIPARLSSDAIETVIGGGLYPLRISQDVVEVVSTYLAPSPRYPTSPPLSKVGRVTSKAIARSSRRSISQRPIIVTTTATGVNALDSATVNVGSTTGFPGSGTFTMLGVDTSYSGTTGTSFTGCGAHPATTGGENISAYIGVDGPSVNLSNSISQPRSAARYSFQPAVLGVAAVTQDLIEIVVTGNMPAIVSQTVTEIVIREGNLPTPTTAGTKANGGVV